MSTVPISRDSPCERSMTESIDSTSSSGSSTSQPAGLVMINTARANGEVEEPPQRAYTDGAASERGSREGSVDRVRGGGRSLSGDTLEKKLIMNRKRKVWGTTTATLEEEVDLNSTEVRQSPKASPRQQSQGTRSRVKQTFISTNV